MSDQMTIIDFKGADKSEWLVINDGVMGGLSRCEFERTEEGTGLFTGNISLENEGGYAATRVSIGKHDLSTHEGLEIRVRGDGRTYQFRLRTDDNFDGVSYRVLFDTSDGEWSTVRFPFEDFLPVFRGQILEYESPMDASQIQQVGFLLNDKKAGPFSLEIDFVRTW
jgi:monofunctional biosynthetic peptidoglycan transglycosylase